MYNDHVREIEIAVDTWHQSSSLDEPPNSSSTSLRLTVINEACMVKREAAYRF